MSRRLSLGEAAGALKAAGWPTAMIPQMIAIGLAESGLQVDARNHNRNGTDDLGWLQINTVHGYDRDKLISDPVYNAAAGLNVWKGQGLGAWVVYNKGLAGPDKVKSVSDALAKAPNAKPIETAPPLVKSPVTDVAGGIDSAAHGAVGGVVTGVKSAGDLIVALGNPHTWVRVVEVIAGLGMVVAGVVLLQKGTVTAAAKAVGGAVPGAAAGAVVTKAPGALAAAL